MNEIEQFTLGWDPTSGFAYRIKPKEGTWGSLFNVPAAEFAAFAAIFNERPLYINSRAQLPLGLNFLGIHHEHQYVI